MTLNKIILLRALFNCISCVFSAVLFAQELPPINVFTPQQYGAENQNWAISQSNDNYIYVANNLGLLEYNGASWKLYNSPNETILRSVKVIDDKIYTGCYMEFGFWKKDVYGILKYHSLSNLLKTPLVEDEQFWQIISVENWILFRSLNRIYIYDTVSKTFEIIESETTITKMYQVDGTIYFQSINKGIYKIQNGKAIPFLENSISKNESIINIFKEEEGAFLFLTQENGFYTIKNREMKPWNKITNAYLSNYTVYSGIQLKDNTYAIGTISNGLIEVDTKGEIIQEINQTNGLLNNTVLALFEDNDLNIWLALDNGIASINIKSPITIFNDEKGTLGTIYTSAIYKDKLYLGTNQGLFYKTIDSKEAFKFVEGTKGQVWCLVELKERLFCGHNSGTFLIKNGVAEKIADIQGTWSIKPIQGQENLLLQGNYNGLNILERQEDTWAFKNKIEGFDISSRFFELINANEIIMSHEYKGVFNVKLDASYTQAIHVTKDTVMKELHSSLFKYNDAIYYAFNKGVFKYNFKNKNFEKDSIFSQVYDEENFVSGKIIVDKQTGNLWSFTKNNISYITPGKLSKTPIIKRIPISNAFRKGVPSYENVLNLSNKNYLFGTSSGYIIIDINAIKEKSYQININTIGSNAVDGKLNKLNKAEIADLEYAQNNILFEYSVPEFDKFQNVEFQHQLVGIYNQWSDWTSNASVLYKNLPSGTYRFNVRGRIGGNITSNIATYEFEIQKPWYLSNTMVAIYIIVGVLLLLFTHNLYNSYFRKQREVLLKKTKQELEHRELENAQQLMQFKNEKLQRDIENKNRELAISTMSLIKKNEFLNDIKKELNHAKTDANLNPVIKIIDKNINNTDDWKLFQEAFNNADKDFLKKVKSKHPKLTPNDLRLCAYLRLNLSSKEIAPLLNISPRSVEVKRYRLRKKMDLPHETGLTSYILEL
ncbi:triple tyrosine motif-containing protein [Lacinutrix neustonica]|uniref:Triple tyrosine motif-containing protein n=1 Tax=Lacinutrix neustonica TaxID=2980107 RepID=A0A9E8MXM1_9FLAO|nr:triple tyrosine motif-containing protein [Lacinutrix neustonica]WAC02770.1 triple tyrosine motif-containing protein [Lacinutrix neustonica]